MAEKRYLISVGINDYEGSPLDYSVKDSEDIISAAISFCNVREENICHVKSDTKSPNAAVYDSILKGLERIKVNFVQGEDSLFFYFSGHGTKSGSSTALVMDGKIIQLQTLFDQFLELKPKFIFCLIDSCFSGVGITEAVEKAHADFLLSQHLKVATGYNIVCASAGDSKAKEDENIKNGRFTRVFIDILRDKENYKNGILNLSKIYQLIDECFKDKPEYRQIPFAQTKGVSTYPLAVLDESEEKMYFSLHYVSDVDDYDWTEFKLALANYCSLRNDLINEFTRLVREFLRNCKEWSQATHTRIEVTKGLVQIIDNSGNYFDLFNPPKGTVLKGGGKTAQIFHQHFQEEYKFNFQIIYGETIQSFEFVKPTSNEPCVANFRVIEAFWEFAFKNELIVIPEECEKYTIHIQQGFLDLSTADGFLDIICKSSHKYKKTIIIIFEESDRLKEMFIEEFERIKTTCEGDIIIQ